jgi:hypothetical protein
VSSRRTTANYLPYETGRFPECKSGTMAYCSDYDFM